MPEICCSPEQVGKLLQDVSPPLGSRSRTWASVVSGVLEKKKKNVFPSLWQVLFQSLGEAHSSEASREDGREEVC